MNKNLQKSRIFDEKGNFFCEHEDCQRITSYIDRGFNHHLKNAHGLSVEAYYLRYLMDENENLCESKTCRKEKKFIGIRQPFKRFCSGKCAQNNKGTLAARNATIEKNYGSHKAFHAQIKTKTKITHKEKYGVDHFFQSEQFKSKNDYSGVFHKSNSKRAATNLERYGSVNPFGSPEIKEKIKATNIENFGVENWMQSEEAKEFFEDYWTDERRQEHSDTLTKAMSVIAPENLLGELESRYEVLEKIPVDGVKYPMYSYRLKCREGHEFIIQRQLIRIHKNRNTEMCSICNPVVSSISQSEILNFIKEIVGEETEVVQNYRKAWGGKMEIDIFVPSHNLGVEYDSNYYHSDAFKDHRYHLNKTLACKEKGIQLIHVWEDQWKHKREIVQSRLRNLLKNNVTNVRAKDCDLKVVSFRETKEFLNENHIQGWCVSGVSLGLYFNGQLVSIMTFGGNRANTGRKAKEGEFELLRFCNALNHSVSYGASRLFTNFVRIYNPTKVRSYCDRAWSNGDLYEKLGFNLHHESDPGFYYIIDGIRQNRWNFRKSALVEMGHNSTLTAEEIMSSLGHSRIYDCGNLVYEWSKIED